MNKALPWNINGVGFDAREAAREAARRQGKSLGEWLHGVIADHAAELGVAARDVAEQDRIDAVTTRLERLSGRETAFDRRRRANRSVEPRPALDEDEPPLARRQPRREPEAPRRATRSASFDEAEYLLEEAIDAMERRAERSERRTDTALADFAKLLETNEAKREREREAVRELTQKLSTIESQLTSRANESDVDTPVKSALARLEARLETIARRSNAETTAHLQSGRPLVERRADAEPMRRLEEKLNTILDVVAARTPVPPASEMPVEKAVPTRRLGEAIAEISRRQAALDTGRVPPVEPRRARPVVTREQPVEDAPWQRALVAMQSELSALAGKIDNMRLAPARAPAPTADGLRAELDLMAKMVRDLAPRGDVAPLHESIDSLMQQVERSRDEGVRETALRPVEVALGDLREKLPDIDPRPLLGQLEREMKTIAEKVDHISDAHAPALSRIQQQMLEIRDLLAATAAKPLAVETIERQVSALAERLDRLPAEPSFAQGIGPAADTIRSMISGSHGEEALVKIEARLERLAERLDDAMPPQTGANDVAGLERLVRELANRIEAAQAPGADNGAIDALQRQVAMLAARFERSESGLASLAGLERSMHELFAEIEATRASVETSAAKAAREVLRIAADESRSRDRPIAPDAAALKAMQLEADKRTQSTLSAVHETLEHVVGRMSAMEADIAKVRRAPSPEPTSARREAPKIEAPKIAPQRPTLGLERPLGGVDPLTDPLFAQRDTAKAERPRPMPSVLRPQAPKKDPVKDVSKTPSADGEAGRADFIAAARRAAKVAQTDPSVIAMKESASQDGRASLIAKSRDYVATHKRPVLLSIAAVFVVLGTMAIVQRMTFDASDPEMASLEAPARIVKTAAARAPAPVAEMPGDLTPSALPKSARALAAQIPGSDPAPTSSIQSLPSFAAEAATPPQPSMPAGLLAAAKAGNGAAEYELAMRYADGRTVARDLKTAADWYQKAADQGLAPAQYRLAALYEKGLGVPLDKVRARDLYQRAADSGNPRAMHNLAVLLADGEGRPDYAAAAGWFRKAAQYGVHDSQYNLAILLARGMGVEQSLVQSYQWFAIAATHDDADAAKKRDEVGDKLSANDLAVAKALAASFQPRSADPSATEVTPPPGGWDSVGSASHLNSARSRISSL